MFAEEAAAFGRATALFRAAVRDALRIHRDRISDPSHQLTVARLADISIDLFGWGATLSRASTAAQAPGEPNPNLEHEIDVAKLAIRGCASRIATAHSELMRGEATNGDNHTLRVAEATLKAGKYLPRHPLGV